MNVDRETIESNLRSHVDRLAGLIGPRTLDRPKTIDATIDYLRGQWQAMQHEVRDEVYDALGDQARNLVVEKMGTRRPDDIILLGAHYDTVSATPGADDNASAVAVMLEVSRLLKDHVGKRTARYVAFACEEAPYYNLQAMGSQHHARQARQRNERIVAMLCLEMVGYFRDEIGSQQIPPGIPTLLRRFFPKRGDFFGRGRQSAFLETGVVVPPWI